MKFVKLTLLSCLFTALALYATERPDDAAKYWAQWRGPDATGVAPYGKPPVEWSESKNIRWKIEVPGKGLASPVIWENQIFLMSAVETDQVIEMQAEPAQESSGRRRRRRGIKPTRVVQFTLFAINRKDGSIQWQDTALQQLPHAGTHNDGSWASGSAITDGKHVYAFFGSYGIFCYDMKGNLKWKQDLGDMRTRNSFGEGSSPVLSGNRIILNWDHEDQSFITALDKNTGKTLWKTQREERTSWSTPLVVEVKGKAQVIVSATSRTRAYDVETGELVWEAGGMTVNSIPSPVSADGMLYVTSGFRGSALQAIRLADAKGDITDTDAVVWAYNQDTPYVPSPLLYGDKIYVMKSNSGILSCVNVKTGELFYGPQRLDGIKNIYASPVAADGRVYFTGRDGTTIVIQDSEDFNVLATNKLDDAVDASIAIVDKELFLRGRKHLYCIAED